MGDLKGLGDADLGNLVHFLIGDIFSQEERFSRGGDIQPAQEVEEGGFARSVRADDRLQLPFLAPGSST